MIIFWKWPRSMSTMDFSTNERSFSHWFWMFKFTWGSWNSAILRAQNFPYNWYIRALNRVFGAEIKILMTITQNLYFFFKFWPTYFTYLFKLVSPNCRYFLQFSWRHLIDVTFTNKAYSVWTYWYKWITSCVEWRRPVQNSKKKLEKIQQNLRRIHKNCAQNWKGFCTEF